MSKKIGRIIFLFLILIPTLVFANQNEPEFDIKLDRKKATQDQPFYIYITLMWNKKADITPEWNLDPDLFEINFEGIAPSHSSMTIIINGKTKIQKESSYRYTYQLVGLKKGLYTLNGPIFNIDGKKYLCGPIQIRISGIEKNPYYTLNLTDLPNQITVGERVDFDLIFEFTQKVESISFKTNALKNKKISLYSRPLDKKTRNFQINKSSYEGVILGNNQKNWVNIPLSIIANEPTQIDLSDFRAAFRGLPANATGGFISFFDEEDILIPLSNSVNKIKVLPLPKKNKPKNFSGLIGKLQLEVNAEPTKIKVGDPLSIKIKIKNINDYQYKLPQLKYLNQDFSLNFKIPENRSPGRMVKSNKLFIQTIRPKRTDVKEIPSIKLNYYDTELHQYKILESPAIPLIVNEAKIIDENNVIYNNTVGRDLAIKYNDNRQFHNLAYGISADSISAKFNFKLFWIFIILFSLITILIILLLIILLKTGTVKKIKKRRNDQFELLIAKTIKEINTENNFDSYIKSLTKFRNTLVELSKEKCIPYRNKILYIIDGEIFNLDKNKFDSQNTIKNIKNVLEEYKTQNSSKKKKNNSKIVAITIIFLTIFSFNCTFTKEAKNVKIDSTKANELLQSAKSNFKEGLNHLIDNKKNPKEFFEQAFLEWNEIAESGYSDDRIYFNMGNCMRFLNEDAQALYWYKKALLYKENPLYREATQTLMKQNGFILDENSFNKITEKISVFSNRNSLISKIGIICLLSLFIVCLYFISYLSGKKTKSIRVIIITLILLIMIIFTGTIFQNLLPKSMEEGIIMNDTDGYSGDSYAYSKALNSPLYSGQIFRLIETRKGWYYISLSKGIKCWIPENSAIIIDK